MKNLEITKNELENVENILKKQKVRHEQKEYQVTNHPCIAKMKLQHALKQERTLNRIEKLLLKINGNPDGLVKILEPFIMQQTETILKHTETLRTFKLVQSNKEAMTNIALFEERVIKFKIEEKWFKREINIVGEFFGRVITPILYPKGGL